MAEAAMPWINAQCTREALSPAGFGATIWAAADAGEITAEEAPLLVRSLLSAGLDTTIVDIGNALYAFATNPAQWQALREKPALVRPAFDEVLRCESPIQTFFRTTTRTVDIGGVEIPQDAKVLLFLASADRDPRRWDEPERFDVNRRAAGHVAFGAGIHLCVGQMLARLEAEMLVTALAARVERIDIIGEPKRKLSNSLRQFASLPVELIAAQ
jgi:cytochrome P450